MADGKLNTCCASQEFPDVVADHVPRGMSSGDAMRETFLTNPPGKTTEAEREIDV